MSKVNIANVVILNNPASFFDPFKFEITFECYEKISDDLEFKLIYVGSAESQEYDQELDSVLVGPELPEGRHMFVFEAGAPNPAKIPQTEAADVTVILLTCSFKGQEFIKIGYFVMNEYTEQELKENPPAEPLFDKLTRFIDNKNPRVTKIPIKWGDATTENGLNGEQVITEQMTDASLEDKIQNHSDDDQGADENVDKVKFTNCDIQMTDATNGHCQEKETAAMS